MNEAKYIVHFCYYIILTWKSQYFEDYLAPGCLLYLFNRKYSFYCKCNSLVYFWKSGSIVQPMRLSIFSRYVFLIFYSMMKWFRANGRVVWVSACRLRRLGFESQLVMDLCIFLCVVSLLQAYDLHSIKYDEIKSLVEKIRDSKDNNLR